LSGNYWNATRQTYAGTSSSGSSLNQLSSPTGIFFDSSDNLYVADGGNYRVMKYAVDNSTGTVIAGTTGTSGTSLSLLSTGARYLYVDSSQNLYIGDAYNNRVLLWTNGASTGVIVAGNGTYGTSLNQIYYPYGVWVDSSSNVFVAEYQNHRITEWASGASSGVIVAGITSSSGKSNRAKII
jgi:sugar lactone lactonase YvrE